VDRERTAKRTANEP